MCEHTGTKWLYTLGGLGLGVVLMVAWIICSMWNWPMYGMRGFNDFRPGYGRNTGMMGGSEMTMNGMVGALSGKSGDAFDAAFLNLMIPHHQGAVYMAQYAADNAKHQEVKDLAKSIIAAQNKEITQMKAMQAKWGYSQQ